MFVALGESPDLGKTGPRSGSASLVRALSDAMDPTVVLRRIVDQALVLVPGAEGSVVELVDTDDLVYVCAAGNLAGSEGVRVPSTGSLSGLAVATRQVLICDDAESDNRVDLGACRQVGVVSMLCVPLLQTAGAVGVLKVASSQARAFTPRDIHVLSRLAEFISTTVATASEFSRLIDQVVNSNDCLPPNSAGLIDPDDDDIAWFVANVIRPGIAPDINTRRQIESILQHSDFQVVYQPILDLSNGRLVGAEALARFTPLPYRPPDMWFADAEHAGLGVELELAAARAALAALPHLPDTIRLSINVGPTGIATPELIDIIEAAGPHRVIIELTEHLKVEDYPRLNQRLAVLRRQHTLLAIDDTGAGISSLTHILKLAPDVIKLDREITSGIDIDPVRRALTSALVTFARESGATVVAEGIENNSEVSTLQDLGVTYGQGFHLGRPAPAEHLHQHTTVATSL